MRRYFFHVTLGAGLFAVGASTIAIDDVRAQDAGIAESAVTLFSSGGGAELWIELDDGSDHRIRLDDGAIQVDGATVASYASGAGLADAWRTLLLEHAGADGASVRAALVDFRRQLADGSGARGEDEAASALGEQLDAILGLAVASDQGIEEAATIERADGSSLQLAPGGLEFDFSGGLERLRGALGRLSGAGQSIDDRLAMIVHDDFEIPRGGEIEGNVAVLSGTLRLAGEVEGDVLVLDGTLRLEDGARIDGDVLQVGGGLELDGDTGVIEGEILSDFPTEPAPPAPAAAPESPSPVVAVSERTERSSSRDRGAFARFAHNLGHAAEGLMGALSTFVGLAVLGLLLVYFAQGRLETVSDTVRHEFARSFAMGLAGQVLFFPALLVMVVLVITWPIVPFFVLGCGLAAVMGYLGVAHGAGEMFARRRYRYEWLERLRRSNSYYYVISGLVLLLLPFAAGAVSWVLGGTLDLVRGLIAFVACVGTWVLITAGFGSVLLTRAGGRSIVVDWAPAPEDVDLGDGAEIDPDAPPDPASEGGSTDDPSSSDGEA
ncbi:MAG: polymer-forming cytoskeletal protein [Gemmatimonadetes bacterium]|nr:polymer-forming cytoskeletal protein [Gemmatimonadota bacterium]